MGRYSLRVNVSQIDNPNNPLNICLSASVINVGGLNNDNKVINIGGVNDVVNILGRTNYIETTNTQVKNKVMVLNEGEVGNLQSNGVGLLFKDNDVENKGYLLVNGNCDEFHFKAPNNDNVFKVKTEPTEFYDLANKLYVDAQDAILINNINLLTNTQTGLTEQIATINNNVLQNIPFSKINAWPSDNNHVLYGDGVFRNPGQVNVVLQNQSLTDCTVNDQLLSEYSGKIPNTKWVADKLNDYVPSYVNCLI